MEIKDILYERVSATAVKMTCPYCRKDIRLESGKLSNEKCRCGAWTVRLEARFDYIKGVGR